MGGYMSNRTYQCTRCNEVFTYNSDRDALYCPICGSTARYVGNTTSVNQNITTGKNKYYNVTFTDPSTKKVSVMKDYLRQVSIRVVDGKRYFIQLISNV